MYKKTAPAILIVDDDRKVLKSLSIWLKSEGFEPYIASGRNEALKIVRNASIDAALVDFRMSKEDGISVTRRLLEVDNYLKVIILTGFPSYESAVRAMKVGVFDYISKGISNQKILKTIKRAVEERANDMILQERNLSTRNIVKIILFCNHSLIKERLENFSRNSSAFRLVKSFPQVDFIKARNISQEIDIALICAGCYLRDFKDSYVVIPELYRCLPGVKPVIINENFSDSEKVEMLKLGVRGFSSRDLSSKMLEKALFRIKKGEIWVSRNVTNLSLKEMMKYDSTQMLKKKEVFGLTDREVEILRTMALGLKNREIADKLFISEKTVKTHINRIFKKLGVNTRTRAILTAIEKRIL